MIDFSQTDNLIAEALVHQPIGTNPFDWGLRPLIEGSPEERDLLRTIKILENARTIVGPETLHGMVFRLYQMEVERRPPTADCRVIGQELSTTLQNIESKIVSRGDMNMLCPTLGDAWYNLGINDRMRQMYFAASRCQERAAAYYLQDGGHSGKVWASLFLVEVESFTMTVVDDGQDEINKALDTLLNFWAMLEVKFPGDQMPGWLQKNMRAHCALASVWAGETKSKETRQQLKEDLKSCQNIGGHLAAMASVILTNESAKAMVMAANKMADEYWDYPSSSTGNAVLTALLAAARVAIRSKKTDVGRRLCEKILDWSGNDGGAPMARAQSILNTLDALGAE